MHRFSIQIRYLHIYKTEMPESTMHPEEVCYTWKKRGITLQPTYVCDKIFIFLIVALCLLPFISNLFLRLHHQGIDILVTLRAIPSTISWWWSKQPEDWIHPKSTVVLMAAVIFSSTEYVWARVQMTVGWNVKPRPSHAELRFCSGVSLQVSQSLLAKSDLGIKIFDEGTQLPPLYMVFQHSGPTFLHCK